MHDREKSDRLVVPAKPPNNPGGPGAEVVGGKGPARGEHGQRNAHRTQCRGARVK